MAPTRFLPRSHTRSFHAAREEGAGGAREEGFTAAREEGFTAAAREEVSTAAGREEGSTAAAEAADVASAAADVENASLYCSPLLRAGDAVLMDAACFHAGGANTLRRRTLFHLSFCRGGFEPGGFASFAQSLGTESGTLCSLYESVIR